MRFTKTYYNLFSRNFVQEAELAGRYKVKARVAAY